MKIGWRRRGIGTDSTAATGRKERLVGEGIECFLERRARRKGEKEEGEGQPPSCGDWL